ncbi:MAG: AAA family ATPase [Xanthomonadales bacterium]|nr:AAA family ATPase [Xanthomonadales bacterium]
MSSVSSHPPEQGALLIGREVEQRALARALDNLARPPAGGGQGQVVLLSGEPGIGKSALARWTANRARDAGIPVHWGFAWEAGGAPPYWPWTQCLRALLGDGRLPPPLADGFMARLATPLAQVLPELAAAGEALPPLLQPDQARFQLLEAVRSLLAETAAAHPFVLAFEDLHAADRESLLLLQHVCRHAVQGGYLVLGTFRELEARLADESSPLWRCAREALVLPLRGLCEQDVQALLERRAGRPAPSGRVRQIHAATEGNPLFLTELLALPSADLVADDAMSRNLAGKDLPRPRRRRGAGPRVRRRIAGHAAGKRRKRGRRGLAAGAGRRPAATGRRSRLALRAPVPSRRAVCLPGARRATGLAPAARPGARARHGPGPG